MSRVAFIALLGASMLSAQTNRGSISGTVTDSSQAVIPGVSVTVTNLEPVTYKITVVAKGFRRETVENVKVDTAANTTVNITLQPGSVDTELTVSATAAMIDTQSGTASNTITERQIQDAPLLNRSVLDLALTLPNVAGDAGSENPVITSVTPCPGCNLTVGGGRPMSTLIMADGTNNTGISLARTLVSFTPETVQEFTVQT